MARLLLLVVVPFKIWMLYDAWQRRAETYWLWVIIGVPGGALAYLFFVRLRDHDARQLQQRVLSAVRRPPSLEQLQFRYERTPTIASRITLAQALGDAGRWPEAAAHFGAVLARRPEEHDALYGAGVCALELGRYEEATEALERLESLNPGYRDFALYPELAEAYERQGAADQALELLRTLARREPRLRHVVVLAERLVEHGERREAVERLQTALREHADAPRYVRRNDRRWARRATALVRELSAPRS